MAQTRASSKALRLPLGFVMHLAGFEATPADETPADIVNEPVSDAVVDEKNAGAIPPEAQPTTEQKTELGRLLVELADRDPSTDWKARAREIAGVEGKLLTRGGAGVLIDKLTAELEEKAAA